jgi:hypothetical protein
LGAEGRFDYISISAGGPSPQPSRRRKKMEVMMNDQIFDRDYQAGRTALNDSISQLIHGAGQSLRMLHKIQFDAPWKQSVSTKS